MTGAVTATTLVRGGWVLAMDPARELLRDGAVAFGSDGEIGAVGPWEELRARFPEAEVVGDGNGLVVPGFVNAHTHLTEGLIAGMGETASLWEWFDRVDLAGRPGDDARGRARRREAQRAPRCC